MIGRYRKRYTVYEMQYKAIHWWEVCYDKCTGEEACRDHLKKVETKNTQDVMLKAWEEYNRREVDSHIIVP